FEGGYPDFARGGDDWAKLHLIHGGKGDKKIGKSAHFKSSQNAQMHAGVSVPNKIPSDVAMRMAGFTMPNEPFWLPRNTHVPPIELQRQIFPFIESCFNRHTDWLSVTENIMLDRKPAFGRHSDTRLNPGLSGLLLSRILTLLLHLRKVILQDAAVLLDLRDDSACNYGLHRIFGLPVFESAMFADFRTQLRERMRTESSPITDSLRNNAPAMHSEFRAVKSKLNDIDNKLNIDLIGAFDQRMDHHKHAWLSSISNTISEAIGASLDEIKDVRRDLRKLNLLETMEEDQGSLKDFGNGPPGLVNAMENVRLESVSYFAALQLQQRRQQPQELEKQLQQVQQEV
ncbi:hypothetical protein BGZ58_004821, partial [Dissophora ornata]